MLYNKNIIITAGIKYLDIDAYASMLAYRDFLKSLGYNAWAMTSSSVLNSSIPKSFLDNQHHLDKMQKIPDAEYVILDTSFPDFIDKMVDRDKISEIIDHHPEGISYWQDSNVKIEIIPIGAVCTIIYERIKNKNKLSVLDSELCKLLAAGILDNTINLQALATTDRDRIAFKELCELGKLPPTFNMDYFKECYKNTDIHNAIINDIKIFKINNLLPEVFGQVIVLNDININIINEVFKKYDSWMINVINLQKGKSYIYYSNNNRENLEKLFNTKAFQKGLIILDNVMLRKEIVALAESKN